MEHGENEGKVYRIVFRQGMVGFYKNHHKNERDTYQAVSLFNSFKGQKWPELRQAIEEGELHAALVLGKYK